MKQFAKFFSAFMPINPLELKKLLCKTSDKYPGHPFVPYSGEIVARAPNKETEKFSIFRTLTLNEKHSNADSTGFQGQDIVTSTRLFLRNQS